MQCKIEYINYKKKKKEELLHQRIHPIEDGRRFGRREHRVRVEPCWEIGILEAEMKEWDVLKKKSRVLGSKCKTCRCLLCTCVCVAHFRWRKYEEQNTPCFASFRLFYSLSPIEVDSVFMSSKPFTLQMLIRIKVVLSTLL